MPNRLTDIHVNRVSIVDRAAVRSGEDPTQPQGLLLFKSETDVPAEPSLNKEDSMSLMDLLRKASERERSEALEELGKASDEPDDTDDDPEDDDESKSKRTQKAEKPSPRQRERGREEDDADDEEDSKEEKMEKAEIASRLAKAEQRAEEAEKLAKHERDQRVAGEFIAKAEKDFGLLDDPLALGPRLMRMQQALSKEDYEAELTRMAATQEQLAHGDLLKQYGRDGAPLTRPASASGDPLKKAQERAEELRKAEPELSSADAFARAWKENHKDYVVDHSQGSNVPAGR